MNLPGQGLRIPQRRPDTAPSERASSPSRLGRGLDLVSDWGVLAFASWTLIAYAGMVTQARVSLLVPVWLATVPLLGVVLVALSRQSHGPMPRVAPAPADGFVSRYGRYLLTAALAGGLASVILVAATRSAPWTIVWAGAFVAIVAAVVMGRLRSEGPAGPQPSLVWPAHAFAAFVGLALATMSLFIDRGDGDDVFYVNRAVGTAQLNRIPVRDIILTNERVPPVSGAGIPVDTFSALQGALARFTGVHAASVVYYVTPPLMTFFATWALWRLLRSWAPRNVVLCFALGCAYWLFSAQRRLMAGSFFLTRMWQGKVIFTAWLVLTAYVFLTRWLTKRDALTAVLVLATGVGSIGMTGSASFVAPLIFGAAAVPLLARRDWRGLPVLMAAAAFPFLVGFVAAQKYPITHFFTGDGLVLPAKYLGTSWYFHEVFGWGLLAAVGLSALLAAPWLARAGPAARLASGIAVVSMLLLAPFVLPALNDLTGLKSVLRRALWVVPVPAMVGLLAAAPVAQLLGRLARGPTLRPRLAALTPALLVAGLLVAFGHPLWVSLTGEPLWTPRPTWRISHGALSDARGILRRYRGSGPVLADPRIMRAIALITVRPKAVNPRSFYTRYTPEQPPRTSERLALTLFVSGEEPKRSRQGVEHALSDLGVGLVCVAKSKPLVIREVEATGDYHEAFQVRGKVCLLRDSQQ